MGLIDQQIQALYANKIIGYTAFNNFNYLLGL